MTTLIRNESQKPLFCSGANLTQTQFTKPTVHKILCEITYKFLKQLFKLFQLFIFLRVLFFFQQTKQISVKKNTKTAHKAAHGFGFSSKESKFVQKSFENECFHLRSFFPKFQLVLTQLSFVARHADDSFHAKDSFQDLLNIT